MSGITGNGYGSKHNWKRGDTSPCKSTLYKCANCGYVFFHNYDDVPDIFDAIKRQGIPEECVDVPNVELRGGLTAETNNGELSHD